jgi:putative ABC transport system permease protein
VYRREWRQQVLVIALLTFTVSGALLGVSVVYNTPGSLDARYGTADMLIRYGGADPQELDSQVASAQTQLGTVDVIGHRNATIPGLTRPVEVRAQDPHGPYGATMLRLVSGRYPAAAGEAAATDEVAALMRLRVGGQLTLADRTWSVVGVVENTHDLKAEFVLVSPAGADPPESVTILSMGPPSRIIVDQRSTGAGHRDPRSDARTAAATYAFALVVLAMFLVCFVAASAFITMTQRRMRQFGMLAATGATERHVRLVMLAAGALAGIAAAVFGTVVAAALWIVAIPRLEPAVGHRIEAFSLPWWLIGACLLLAVVTATAAAWWPARVAARIPITQALSQRPPRPRPARRWAVLGLLLMAAGVACLRLGSDNAALVVAGSAAALAGLPLLAPLAIRGLARAGARLPVAARLALRDLARHQARSGAALAAISLGLAVAAIVVIAMAASEPTAAEGNLSDRQLLIAVTDRAYGRVGSLIPDRTPAQIAAADAAVGRFAATLGGPTLVPLDAAVRADEAVILDSDGGPPGRVPAFLIQLNSSGDPNQAPLPLDVSANLYVATPQLLRYYGLGPAAIGPGTEVLTPHRADDLSFFGGRDETRAATAPLRHPAYQSLPDGLLTPEALRRHGLTAVRVGWLIETERPLTTAQLAAARDLALDNGLIVESRDTGPPQAQIRGAATAAGGVLALGVLAMTVGLIRGEAARDLRTLTATGATRRIRRTLAATTALGLAVLGAILGVAVAYLAAAAVLDEDIGLLKRVPVIELAVTLVGVPLVAAAAGWLLSGREPRSLTREP